METRLVIGYLLMLLLGVAAALVVRHLAKKRRQHRRTMHEYLPRKERSSPRWTSRR